MTVENKAMIFVLYIADFYCWVLDFFLLLVRGKNLGEESRQVIHCTLHQWFQTMFLYTPFSPKILLTITTWIYIFIIILYSDKIYCLKIKQ